MATLIFERRESDGALTFRLKKDALDDFKFGYLKFVELKNGWKQAMSFALTPLLNIIITALEDNISDALAQVVQSYG